MRGPLRPGDPETVGPYRLRARLGAGGMGDVFLGEDGHGQHAAVKLMRRELTSTPEYRSRFRREIEAGRRVDGRFTARVLAADPEATPPWLATEFIDGPTLHEDIHMHGPVEGELLLGLAVALADAVAGIHRVGLAHRDLKPGNVLLGDDGPMVVDFGIARAADSTSITQTGGMLGSPAFMAPEQAEGGTTGPPADVFAWGATVAFAATGASPFAAETPAAALYRVVHTEPDLGSLDEPLRSIVARSLSKDVNARPTGEQLLRSLTDTAETEPALRTLLATTWPSRSSTRRRTRLGRAAAWVAGVIVVLAAATGTVAVLLRDEPDAASQSERRSSTTSTNVATSAAPAVETSAAPAPPTTVAPPPTTTPTPRPQQFATVDCPTALGVVAGFEGADEIELAALFQAFVGPAPRSNYEGLRFVGLRRDSGSGDPHDYLWRSDTGLVDLGNFFDFDHLRDPAVFPVVIFEGPDGNFVCEVNLPR